MDSLEKIQSFKIETRKTHISSNLVKGLLNDYFRKLGYDDVCLEAREDADLLTIDPRGDVRIREIVEKWGTDTFGPFVGFSDLEKGFKLVQKVLNNLKGR